MTSRYLIYALVDPRTDEIRYIGKSCNGLARPKTHATPAYMERWKHTPVIRWIRKLHTLGLGYRIQILEELDVFSDLGWHEQKHIAYQRLIGARLLNCTDGGDGAPGFVKSPETRRLLSEKQKVYLQSEKGKQERAERAIKDRGRKRGSESRRRMSDAHGGRPFVDQYGRRYISQGQAATLLNINQSSISQVLLGRFKQTRGYTFTYVEASCNSL